jgi:uncharacterized protein YjbI with pentapeptide repeats
MEIAHYGLAEVVLPHLDEELYDVEHLDGHEPLRHFNYRGHAIRHLSVTDRTLSNGRVSKVEAQRATISRLNAQSVEFDQCVLSSADWDECVLSRVVFRNCKILGAAFTNNKWSNLVFEDCKIEYTTFNSVRAGAPVVFVNSTLSDVTFEGCDLPNGHMSGCALRGVEFVGGGYHRFDLRGNDLSTIRGASNLDGVVISRAQRQELAEALVSELNLHYVDNGDP